MGIGQNGAGPQRTECRIQLSKDKIRQQYNQPKTHEPGLRLAGKGHTLMLNTWFAIPLWQRVIGALILGIIAGLLLQENATTIKWIGDLFVRLIRMLVIPLVFITIVSGVIAMADPKRLGSIGLKAFALFMLTTLGAIIIGLTLGTLLQPGAGAGDLVAAAAPGEIREAQSLSDRLLTIVPSNPIQALASGDVLATIFFALFFGIGILAVGEKAKPVADFVNAASEVILKLALMVMELAPFGVFALIAWAVGTQGLEVLVTTLLPLTFAVYLGCFMQIFLVHGGMVRFIAGMPYIPFFRSIVDPQLVAYSTSSSSATLPVTLATAERNLGIQPPVATSVLPLGATINMDGTALYVGIVTLFAAQAFGIDLTFSQYLTVALTTTLVSIGTAAVPSASLFLIAAVLGTIGVSPEQTALIVGFILPFDRILDMMRTATNVTGDLAVATTVARSEGELDEEIFREPNVA